MIRRYQSPQNNGSPDQPSPTPPPGLRRVAVRMPLAEPRLTYVLLAVIVLIGLYTFTLSSAAQLQFLTNWAKINGPIRNGEYYRLFTSMFLHLNLTHLVFNGYALYVLGRDVESLFGTVRFALIYFLGGLSGALSSFVFTSAPSVGASGAIFAIFGAEMVYFYQHRDLHGAIGRRHLQQLFFIMLLNLGLGFFSTTGATSFRIDNAGHIGGLIGGLVLAWFIGPAYRVHRDPEMEGGLTVLDENPIERWALLSLLYTVGLVAMIAYAVTA
jgi:rhomboid protease GluP